MASRRPAEKAPGAGDGSGEEAAAGPATAAQEASTSSADRPARRAVVRLTVSAFRLFLQGGGGTDTY
ncbi:hypothetical protein GCM10023329_45970 [Streptomyces sanyensis]|uniref:Uncharacterized protein n=1 Tax=Streptomyces sanyensis TaxID=568869 RepID=A0ABP9B1S3_9ACTN